MPAVAQSIQVVPPHLLCSLCSHACPDRWAEILVFFFSFFPLLGFIATSFSLYSQCLKKEEKKQKKKERENYQSWCKIQKQMKKSASLIFFMAAATWKCCCHSTGSGYTIQPCTSLQCHFIQSHICRVHVLLAVTSHLHFWQNDWDLLFLRATAVTGGGMDTKIRVHRKLTLEKKILPPLWWGLEPTSFRPQVWHWATDQKSSTFVHPL